MTDDETRSGRDSGNAQRTSEREPSPADVRRELLDDDPPPLRQTSRTPVVLIAGAAILAIMLTVIVLNLDDPAPRAATADEDDDVIELIMPGRLGEGDLTDEEFNIRGSLQAQLPRGGWVTLSDEEGRPKQRYRCESLDPSPEGLGPGWLVMGKPEMEIFLADHRVVTLSGDTATAYAPHNAIESGSIRDNVVLKLFEGSPDRPVDVSRDEPALIATTDYASFENFLGEIRCDDWVRIQTPRLDLPGHQLSMLVDDVDNTVRLRINRFEYIRIVDAGDMMARGPHLHAEQSPRPVRSVAHRSADSAATSHAPMRGRGTRVVNAGHDAPASAGRSGATFYRLTIEDRVRIDQGPAHERFVAEGDFLEAIFSMAHDGPDTALSRAVPGTWNRRPGQMLHQHAAHRARGNGSVSTAPAGGDPPSARLASILARQIYGVSAAGDARSATDARWSDDVESLLGPDIVLIRGDGPLTIEPLTDSSRHLASPDDARLEMTGHPLRLCDHAGEIEVTARMLTYHTGSERVEVEGDDEHPLIVDAPDMMAGGSHFHFSQVENVGGFEGGGWMFARSRSEAERLAMACAAMGSNATFASQPHTLMRGAQDVDDVNEPPRPELQITWEDGMDLVFDEDAGHGRGRIRSAKFAGNVRVTSEEFVMNAAEMTVTFPEDAAGPESIERIHARGAVRVDGVATDGAIRCDDLTLDLTETAAGRTIPRRMIARGSVEAIDDDHIIWAELLDVSFREAPETDDRPVTADAADEEGLFGRGRRGDVLVDEFIAENAVQVLLADGTRVFADRLEGDGIRETLDMLGEDLTIISDQMVVDQCSRLEFVRPSGTVHSPGSGRFTFYNRSVVDPQRSRIERPSMEAREADLEVRATWEESMTFDSRFNDGAGSIDLRGDVDVLSTPSPVERNTLQSQALTMEFVNTAPVEGRDRESVDDEAAGQRGDTGSDDRESGERRDQPFAAPLERNGQRELDLLIARGEARIESQVFPDASQEGEPRIFYVGGEHVEYMPRLGEALVTKDGELLIFEPASEADDDGPRAPFGARGTTGMTWTRQLHLKRRVDNVYDVVATGDVEMRHRDPEGAISWLTCEQIDATIVREAMGAEDGRPRGALDFGGSARLERVNATGGVIVRTDAREVECDTFDYDTATAIARIDARPGSFISIMQRGTADVITAERAVWNMEQDTIRITRAVGGGG